MHTSSVSGATVFLQYLVPALLKDLSWVIKAENFTSMIHFSGNLVQIPYFTDESMWGPQRFREWIQVTQHVYLQKQDLNAGLLIPKIGHCHLEQFSLHAFSQLSCFKETYLKFRINIHLPKFILPGETLKTHPSHLLLVLFNRSNGILTHKRGREYNKNRECSKLNKFDFMEISLYCLCFAHFCCGPVKTSL